MNPAQGVVRGLDPGATEVVDQPAVALIGFVVVAYGYLSNNVIFVNFCPMCHYAGVTVLTITIPEPPAPPE